MLLTVLVIPVISISDIRVNEGETLTIACTNNNVPDTTEFQWISPKGQILVDEETESTSVMEITYRAIADRSMAGRYICKVTSKLDGSSLTASVNVIVQRKSQLFACI